MSSLPPPKYFASHGDFLQCPASDWALLALLLQYTYHLTMWVIFMQTACAVYGDDPEVRVEFRLQDDDTTSGVPITCSSLSNVLLSIVVAIIHVRLVGSGDPSYNIFDAEDSLQDGADDFDPDDEDEEVNSQDRPAQRRPAVIPRTMSQPAVPQPAAPQSAAA